jgi:fumigallin biosynthesis monooxygenase-like protein
MPHFSMLFLDRLAPGTRFDRCRAALQGSSRSLPMRDGIEQQAADLGWYPDLVVIYLGMRVYRLGGLRTVLRLRSEVLKSVRARPDGLLYHESFYFSLFPLHIGLRQYWRDFDPLERWTRTLETVQKVPTKKPSESTLMDP